MYRRQTIKCLCDIYWCDVEGMAGAPARFKKSARGTHCGGAAVSSHGIDRSLLASLPLPFLLLYTSTRIALAFFALGNTPTARCPFLYIHSFIHSSIEVFSPNSSRESI
jgi:hypothetical protein